jgi:Terminase RNaseH-like domain
VRAGASGGCGWVLADASGHYSPIDWSKAAIQLYRNCGADRIVAETNYGGAMVESVMRQVDPNIPFKAVHASRGKVARAEPISALYEQGRVHHLGCFPELEDEMCSFTSAGFVGGSPNRVDALVWSLTELIATPMPGYGVFEYYRQRAAEKKAGLVFPGDPVSSPMDRPSLAPPPPADNRVAWRREYDRLQRRETPLHPDSAGNPDDVIAINGPGMKSEFARGSLEWQRQQENGNDA